MNPHAKLSRLELVIYAALLVALVVFVTYVVLFMPGCALDQRLGRIEASVAHVESTTGAGHDIIQNDKWTYRLLAAGLVMVAGTYPCGKLIWIISGAIRNRVGLHATRLISRIKIHDHP